VLDFAMFYLMCAYASAYVLQVMTYLHKHQWSGSDQKSLHMSYVDFTPSFTFKLP